MGPGPGWRPGGIKNGTLLGRSKWMVWSLGPMLERFLPLALTRSLDGGIMLLFCRLVGKSKALQLGRITDGINARASALGAKTCHHVYLCHWTEARHIWPGYFLFRILESSLPRREGPLLN